MCQGLSHPFYQEAQMVTKRKKAPPTSWVKKVEPDEAITDTDFKAPVPDVVDHEDRPRDIKGDTPAYIDSDADFTDPNANPATQAD